MAELNVKSILAVDCGSATTTAILIEPMEGRYRLAASGQAPSTYALPWQDLTLGVGEAVRQIEKVTGRKLLAPGGWPFTPQSSSQQGVDAFIVVASAGQPLPLVLAGLMHEISLASARRAAATTYTSVTNVLSLDSKPDSKPEPTANGSSRSDWQSAEARIQAIRESPHEAILLVGGTDGGAERPVIDMANMLSMAIRVLNAAHRPVIIYAGNRAVRTQIAEILGPAGVALKAVDNIRPTLDVENLIATQTELENLYMRQKMSQLPGFEKLSNWSIHPVVPTSKSFEKVIAYIGRHNGLNVIGLNPGSGATVVSLQVQDYHSTIVRSDAGLGHSLSSLLKNVPIEKIDRWLPFALASEELHNQLLNKSLHPTALPTTYEDLMIEQAVAREALRLVAAQARAGWSLQPAARGRDLQWNLIIGAGRALTRTPHPGYAALMMLDGVEPWGVTSLALDVSGATNVLGSVAAVQPAAAVEVALRDTFLNLGTVVAPLGHGAAGKPALKLKIERQTALQDTAGAETAGGSSQVEEIEVAYGSLELLPLSPGQKATLEIRPARHFDIGLGQPGRGAVTEVEGGILGIIIDARGRPLRLPAAAADRHRLIKEWLSKLMGANSEEQVTASE